MHKAIKLSLRSGYHYFINNRNNLMQTQMEILHQMFPGLTYEQFCSDHPITSWSDWKNYQFSDVLFFQPTSGSTQKCKWIPYTKKFILQLDLAIAAWLYDLYQCYPAIANGVHYWSLSWLPDELRGQSNNNDLKKLSWAKRVVFKNIMAVPNSVQYAKTSEASQFATLCWLAAHSDLTFISIWSPTYLLSLMSLMETHRVAIAKTLEQGRWHQFAEELALVESPKAPEQAEFILTNNQRQLWPMLKVISCWTSADAKIWADKLQRLFPECVIHPKGLFATEGVVSIPIQNQLVLSYRSHFYEFKLADGEIVPSWKLQLGMNVSPILTSANGLTRYHLQDWLKVDGFLGELPLLTFIGREATVDMVGEKIDFSSGRSVLAKYSKPSVCLIANTNSQAIPFYTVLLVGEENIFAPDNELDQLLCEYHHYRVAREFGQLSVAHKLTVKNLEQFLYKIKMQSHLNFGDQKLEAIIKVQNLEELVHAITS
jgi:hypothetical protein